MAMNLENADSKPYWEAIGRGQLLFQRCSCGHVQFPPRHLCTKCWNDTLEWVESSGRGTVESFTVVRRAPIEEFRDKVPYVIVAIVVEEGPRMITNLVGEGALEVAIGDPVTVTFLPDHHGRVLPQFQRVNDTLATA
jgi:uncharacterized OB-fold protein